MSTACVPKSIKTDGGSAILLKEYIIYSNENNTTRNYDTAKLHTDKDYPITEELIESESGRRQDLNKAQHVLRFTAHSETKEIIFRTPFRTKN